MEKARFSVDPGNRLRITGLRKTISPAGKFSIDPAQRLVYTLSESPTWRRKNGGIPSKFVFDGAWRLTPEYNLELIRHSSARDPRKERLVLKCVSLINKFDALIFELTGSHGEDRDSLTRIELTGKWQADELNRIVFCVTSKVIPSTLVFAGAWELNRNQQLVYTFEKTDLKTKTKKIHELLFVGYWQFDSRNRLAYNLQASSLSSFSFRAQLESPNLYPADNMIKYRIGIGLARPVSVKQKIISLYGVWKLSRRYAASFEMQYANGCFHRMEFGAAVAFNKKNEITVALTNKQNEPLGITLTYTHKFFKSLDAQTFVRLRKSAYDQRVEAGISIPF
ncbi:MAG: hypothetical protein WDL87_06780 [Candidatus Omnitrophota bacterium]